MNITPKNLSIVGALVIAISTLINITFSFIVPRYEINKIVEELTYEINRIEIRMVERELTRIEENKCRLSSDDINDYVKCRENVEYRTTIRYLEMNSD